MVLLRKKGSSWLPSKDRMRDTLMGKHEPVEWFIGQYGKTCPSCGHRGWSGHSSLLEVLSIIQQPPVSLFLPESAPESWHEAPGQMPLLCPAG